ncbi:cation diffusion facilitator family transporter [Silvimonas amylolytica]|uniref:cation diffusion facilitator family transporter n=1 Tax=Silvimonas amylolytica TaxID=449663 RepID=UPI00166ACF5E|nr:cation diffusion facilitator family transporter [Silvimonas amylolytica]
MTSPYRPANTPAPHQHDAVCGHDHSHDHAGHDHAHDHKHGHDHNHHHDHDHTFGHAHGVTDQRRIAAAFVIIFAFMLVEVAGGIWSGSLALLADAGHMVSDAAALGFSWLALHYGKRPANAKLTFGYKRLEILAAFVNGCALFLVAAWILFEAIVRFAKPVPILSGTMLWVAVVGLAANIAAFYVLNGGNQENLNMRSAWLHVLGDILGSVAAIVAALVIRFTGWTPIDPLLSVLVALLILKSAWQIVKATTHILLEGTPPNLHLDDIKRDLEQHIEGVTDIHHIHAWAMTAEQLMVTLHAVAKPGADQASIVTHIQQRLASEFNVGHVTVQVETADCVDQFHQFESDKAQCH